jgi:hypothetical protein
MLVYSKVIIDGGREKFSKLGQKQPKKKVRQINEEKKNKRALKTNTFFIMVVGN